MVDNSKKPSVLFSVYHTARHMQKKKTQNTEHHCLLTNTIFILQNYRIALELKHFQNGPYHKIKLVNRAVF